MSSTLTKTSTWFVIEENLLTVETLLDGVMVFNHHYQKMSFMIVDVVANAGKKCLGPLSQRFYDIR